MSATRESASLSAAFARLAPGRSLHGISAALLPYRGDAIDWDGFGAHVSRIHAAGLGVAVNMDTGFGDLLSPAEREQVLDATRQSLGPGVPFFAGAYADPDTAIGWRRSIQAIDRLGARPVLVQHRALHAMAPGQKAKAYAEAAAACEAGAIAFELSPAFAPHGEIWDDETFARVLEIPGILGSKHSSLDRGLELARLAARDAARPDYRLYTGNDLAIDMVAYGSDYLLGLAAFAPASFALRDRCLRDDQTDFLARNDALQHLGNVGFRAPIPAYKHAAAQFLHLLGQLDGDGIHPRAPRRPGSERILLLDCAVRLGLVDDPERAHRERVVPHL